MRAISSMQILATACALILSGCTYEHPGPVVPENAIPAGSTAPLPSPTHSSSKPIAKAKSKAELATPAPAMTSTAHAPNAGLLLLDGPPRESHSSVPVETVDSTAPPRLIASAGASGDTDTGTDFDNLEINDPTLKGKLSILRIGAQPTENHLLAVFVGLKNRTSQRLDLEAQTLYKDKLGNPLNQGSWIPVTLKAHEETEYHSSSISDDAADFLVRIRRASPASALPPP